MRVLALPLLLLAACCSHAPPPPTAAAPPSRATAPHPEPTTADGCRACGGEWAPHGMLNQLSCLCPTKDAGKRCRDGAECEGQCLADAGATEITSAGPPARGYFVGQCSRFRTNFGCHRAIAVGAFQAGPVLLDQGPAQICAD
jgi:hypothetical protein